MFNPFEGDYSALMGVDIKKKDSTKNAVLVR